jgi:NAD(P)-dependent dehydrogenase (short-subunit alcohol dehydrogenase family)
MTSTTHQAPFAGANALIFGGAKGIGRCVSLEWAKRGARLAVADIDEAAAKATAE